MTPNHFILNNRKITFDNIKSGYNHFETNTLEFIRKWISKSTSFTFTTSGSTGNPKPITITRNQILESIKQTNKALNLSECKTALICLDTSKIGGAMMLARSMELRLEMTIVSPSSNPLKDIKTSFDFCAMVPLQVEASSISELNQIKKLIIGGAPIKNELELKLKKIDTQSFHTYGMTETISHVALKEIAPNNSKFYTFLPSIEYRINNKKCLCIKGKITNNNWIETNDQVQLHENTFKWLGRFDNTINSGGYKINLDLLTSKIQETNPKLDFILSSKNDSTLGDALVLISTSEHEINFVGLEFYEIPKEFLLIDNWPLLPSGKIDKKSIKDQLQVLKKWTTSPRNK